MKRARSPGRPPPPASPTPATRRWPLQVFRIGTLVIPSAIAWEVAFTAPHPTQLTDAVTYLLGPLWGVMALALGVRSVDALLHRAGDGDGDGETTLLDRIDVLTASGSSLSWLGAGAIAASTWVGWASLSVVGLMGLGLLHLVVIWTLLRASGADPLRRAGVSRRFTPATAVEGEEVVEELRLADVRIPIGFRLFASGSVGPRWAESRYVVDEDASGGEVVLESEIGPAVRGEHRAPPLTLWLQDVFGLSHSVRVRAGEASLTVLPRLRPVDGASDLLGRSGPDKEPRPERRLPTDGAFRLREYAPGDDARRIHWVRSESARQIVVRLPDELPPDQPAVRLVLDTFLPFTDRLTCRAPDDLLDALVKVWLGVGSALSQGGARVTLVTALRQGDRTMPVLRRLTRGTMPQAQRIGAEVRWQEEVGVDKLFEAGGGRERSRTLVVSYRLQPEPADGGQVRWILVPRAAWARYDEPLVMPSLALLPHPMGSADNRWSRRRKERGRVERARLDRETFIDLCADTRAEEAPVDGFVARPAPKARIRLEALQ